MAREPEKVLKPDRRPEEDLLSHKARTSHKLDDAVPPAKPETAAHKMLGLQKMAGNQAILALLHTSGRPLAPEIRQQMERRFGHPLGQVRIHDDEPTAGLVRQLDASAVTIGQDIYFDSGEYQPHTESGRRLLSHELTHTLQQRHVQMSPDAPIPLSSPYTGAEQEAASVANTVMGNTGEGRIAVSQTQAAPIAQRQNGHPHDRPAFEEQHVGFARYQMREGWIYIEGPSGAGGHGLTQPGLDGVAYNTRTDQLEIVEQKGISTARRIGLRDSPTAVTTNLRQNLDSLISRVSGMTDAQLPRRQRILTLLQQTRGALDGNGTVPGNVRIVITSERGTGVTRGLSRYWTQRGVNLRVEFASTRPQTTGGGGGTTPPPTTPPSQSGGTTPPPSGSTTPQTQATRTPQPATLPPQAQAAARPPVAPRPVPPPPRHLVLAQQRLNMSLQQETRRAFNFARNVRVFMGVANGLFTILNAIGSIEESLQMASQGTVLPDAQRQANRIEAQARQAEQWGGSVQDSFSLMDIIQLITDAQSRGDTTMLFDLSESLGNLVMELYEPAYRFRELGRDLAARARALHEMSEIYLQMAHVPQGASTGPNASQLAMHISLSRLSGTLNTAATYYTQAADWVSGAVYFLEGFAHRANRDAWGNMLADIVRMLREQQRQQQTRQP